MTSYAPFDLKSDAARDENLERNLDFLHKTHMNAILYAYNEGKLEHTCELCERAMDNHRLPKYYRNVYKELVIKINTALAANAAAAQRDQAATTEELATTMLHALAVSGNIGTDEQAGKIRSLETIADKAKTLGGAGNEEEKKTLFDELVQLAANDEDGAEFKKDSMEARPSGSRRSSH